MRLVTSLLVLAGCRQILGIEGGELVPVDAPIDAAIDADRSARKKVITVAEGFVTNQLEDFPLWFAIDDLEVAARAAADGSDLRFASPDGVSIPYELVSWEPSTGSLRAWVRVGLEPDARSFELHYGPSNIEPLVDPVRVFVDGFTAVWHLDDLGPREIAVDATTQRPGAVSGLDATNRVPGLLGGAIRFDTASQWISFANPLAASGSHTISAWVRLRAAPTQYDSIVVVGRAQPLKSRWLHARYAGGAVAYGLYGDDATSPSVIPDETWTLVHWVFDGAARTSVLYRDGVTVHQTAHASMPDTEGNNGWIGHTPEGWGPPGMTYGLDGILDEVRIATTPRSAEYVRAEFANQSSPAQFYSVGPEQLP